MKKIMVMSVHDAFEYVMDHYAPYGLEELAESRDSYAMISIQDTHTGGFGFEFRKNKSCRDVLTLYFDDIVREVDGAVMFNEKMAEEIIRFVQKNKNVHTLAIHCYGGQSRSRAVAAFVRRMYDEKAESAGNEIVYGTLMKTWTKMMHNLC